MVRRGYGTGLGVAAIACVLSTSRDAQAFLLPPVAPGGVSRACSVSARVASSSSVSREGRGAGALSVARGAVENANKALTDEEEGMRVAQIEGFTDKVRCVECSTRVAEILVLLHGGMIEQRIHVRTYILYIYIIRAVNIIFVRCLISVWTSCALCVLHSTAQNGTLQ